MVKKVINALFIEDNPGDVRLVKEMLAGYLVKWQLDSNLLFHSIRYAIERQSLTEELRVLSLVDEMSER